MSNVPFPKSQTDRRKDRREGEGELAPVVVHDGAYVGLVDAHTKGDRRTHDLPAARTETKGKPASSE